MQQKTTHYHLLQFLMLQLTYFHTLTCNPHWPEFEHLNLGEHKTIIDCPDDVARVAAPVLRHRLILRPEAQLERYSPDDAIRAAMASVTVPR